MRSRLFIALTALLLTVGLSPAGAVDLDELDALPPIVTSDNVDLVGSLPTVTTTSSIAFDSDEPIAYISTFNGLHVYDISNPEVPLPISYEPLVGVQNESVDLAERANGDKFVLFAANYAAADTTGYTNDTNRVVTVVEVTDPSSPEVVGHVETPTRTHTVTCADPPECTYAYTDGRTAASGVDPSISVVDLTDFRNPTMAEVETIDTVVPRGHDQDVDDAGIVWHVGQEGTVALEVGANDEAASPESPRFLNSTNELALNGRPGDWNRFIHHNSWRPNATEFENPAGFQGAAIGDGNPPGDEPDIAKGNVLLVTEEFILTNAATCPDGDGEGAFQTWHVPFLDADAYENHLNPDLEQGGGTIEPIAKWQTELLDSDMTVRQPGLCSAHYFDARDDGFVAMGWYEQGLRLLDVRDATDIKQVGYFFTADQETWHAHWVPAYDEDGQTGEPSNVVYTADNVRGVDILRVDLPEEDPAETEDLTAPILPEWKADAELPAPAAPAASLPSAEEGWACRIPTAALER